MKFDPILRFKNSDSLFKLTKTGSKREKSGVDVGQFDVGNFSVLEIDKDLFCVIIESYSTFLRTSPVMEILSFGDDFVEFETLGGFYRLEKQNF